MPIWLPGEWDIEDPMRRVSYIHFTDNYLKSPYIFSFPDIVPKLNSCVLYIMRNVLCSL
jgi:hypothetical protein